MFWYILCFILGANFSFFLYACILAGKNADKEDQKCQKNDIIG